jgi:hypothetical protein
MPTNDEVSIAEMRGTLSGILALIQITRSNISNPEMVERFIADREKTILKLQAEVNNLRASLDDGPSMIVTLQAQARKLKQRILLVQRKADIERLQKLAAQCANLEAEGVVAAIEEDVESEVTA